MRMIIHGHAKVLIFHNYADSLNLRLNLIKSTCDEYRFADCLKTEFFNASLKTKITCSILSFCSNKIFQLNDNFNSFNVRTST